MRRGLNPPKRTAGDLSAQPRKKLRRDLCCASSYLFLQDVVIQLVANYRLCINPHFLCDLVYLCWGHTFVSLRTCLGPRLKICAIAATAQHRESNGTLTSRGKALGEF